MPEVGGPVDPDNEARDLIMSVFGGVSKGERNRIRVRVRTAMAAQAQLEGRFLGGRPPYGYRLADAGPHPNPAKAADGGRLHALVVDEPAAVVVRRIFAEYIAGHSPRMIADRLTADGVPCPSAHDRQRNPHRDGQAWAASAVRAIVLNRRYTGIQVWNRQRKDEVLIDVRDVALGHATRRRWNDPAQWVYSDQPAHPPVIDCETFDRAQQAFAARRTTPGLRRPRATARPYQLRGLLYCGICGRRMHGSWTNNQPYYRCRPRDQPPGPDQGHPPAVLVREAVIVPAQYAWLSDVAKRAPLPAVTARALSTLSRAGRAGKAALYGQLALRLTYHPASRTVDAVLSDARIPARQAKTVAAANLPCSRG